MKKLTSYLTIFLTLLAVLLIVVLQNYFQSFFLAPLIEGIGVFLVVLIVLKISDDSLSAITFFVVILFFAFETSVYMLSVAAGFIDSSLYDVLSWRLVYGLFFTLIWIPLTVYGIKYEEKSLWVLWIFIGYFIHLIINLFMFSI